LCSCREGKKKKKGAGQKLIEVQVKEAIFENRAGAVFELGFGVGGVSYGGLPDSAERGRGAKACYSRSSGGIWRAWIPVSTIKKKKNAKKFAMKIGRGMFCWGPK